MPLPTFEKYTKPLGKEEQKRIVPKVIKLLEKCIGRKKALTNSKIRYYLRHSRQKIWVNSPVMRAVIHHIRVNDMLELLLACQKGYYIATSNEEINTYLHSLYARNSSVRENIDAIREQQKRNSRKLFIYEQELEQKEKTKKKPHAKRTKISKPLAKNKSRIGKIKNKAKAAKSKRGAKPAGKRKPAGSSSRATTAYARTNKNSAKNRKMFA